MAREYIPYNDAEFLAWMNNFITVLNANLATFGLVAADLTPLTNARNDFQTKLGNFQTAEAAFRAASEAKKTSRNAAEPLFRQMAQRINRHPAMTNALRAQLRLTVPKPRQRRGRGTRNPWRALGGGRRARGGAFRHEPRRREAQRQARLGDWREHLHQGGGRGGLSAVGV